MRLLYAQLSSEALTPGKPFEAFTHSENAEGGAFVDMRGQKVVVARADLPAIVENTQAAIEAALAAGREGLPIDGEAHDHGDSHGWIVGVELAGEVVRLIPRWTELGVEKLTKKIRDLFSVSLDLATKTIVGGSLTSWPAVKGLKPVELSSAPGLFELGPLEDEPHEEFAARVRRAFYAQQDHAQAGDYAYCRSVHEGYVLCERGADLYQVTFKESGGEFAFAAQDEWQRMRLVPVEMAAPPANPPEDEMTKEEIEAIVRAVVAEQRPADKPQVDLAGGADALLAQLLKGDGPQITADLAQQLQGAYQRQIAHFKAEAERMAREEIAQAERRTAIADFARKITDGTAGAGAALPVEAARIEKFLGSLTDAQRAEAEGIFASTVRAGLVDLTARGHGRDAKTKRQLPERVRADLTSGKHTVADFRTALLAGALEAPIDEYDLTGVPGQA